MWLGCSFPVRQWQVMSENNQTHFIFIYFWGTNFEGAIGMPGGEWALTKKPAR